MASASLHRSSKARSKISAYSEAKNALIGRPMKSEEATPSSILTLAELIIFFIVINYAYQLRGKLKAKCEITMTWVPICLTILEQNTHILKPVFWTTLSFLKSINNRWLLIQEISLEGCRKKLSVFPKPGNKISPRENRCIFNGDIRAG